MNPSPGQTYRLLTDRASQDTPTKALAYSAQLRGQAGTVDDDGPGRREPDRMTAPSVPVRLAQDPVLATTLLVIDFEATTPAGHRPQPVDVAALAVKHVPGYGPQPTGWIYESLIRPPAFAPVTSMMTRTTGIRPQDVASARTVDQVLAELDAAGDSVRRARGAVAGRCC